MHQTNPEISTLCLLKHVNSSENVTEPMKSHSSSNESVSCCRRPSSSARSWSLSQSLLQNATVGEASSATTTTPSTNSEHSAKKSVVLVKLTDAAIRALEEYVKLANEVRERQKSEMEVGRHVDTRIRIPSHGHKHSSIKGEVTPTQ